MGIHDHSVEVLRKRQLAAQAMELRLSGMTHADIATKLGVGSGATVAKMIQRALERYEEPAVESLRKLDSQRLDALIRAVWQPAMEGSTDHISLAMRLIKQRADLFGLEIRTVDDPQGVVYNVTFQPGSQQITATQVAVAGANVTTPPEPISTTYLLTEQEKAPPPLTDEEMFNLTQTSMELFGEG